MAVRKVIPVITDVLCTILLRLLSNAMFQAALKPAFINRATFCPHDPIPMGLIVEPESSVAKLRALTDKNAISMLQALEPLPAVFLASLFINKFTFAVSFVLLVPTDIERAAQE
jgi:hypothetical protein